MIQKFEIDGLHCLCNTIEDKKKIAYILYPMDMLSNWIATASEIYGTNIVVITGMGYIVFE